MPKNNCNELVSEHFDRVYDNTFDALRRFTASRCANVDLLPDLLQEIYLEYFNIISRKGVKYAKEPIALLMKIARRKLSAQFTLKEKLSSVFISVSEEEYESMPDFLSDTEDTVIDKTEAEEIWAMLSEYPNETKKIFYLYYAEDMPLKEIAAAVKMPLSSVKTRLYRTLNELKERSNSDV